MNTHPNRRELLRNSGLALGAGLAAPILGRAAEPASKDTPFAFSFNMATIMGQKVPVVKQVEITAKAGYDAYEPWIRDLDQYVKDGGDLKDLGKRIADAGLKVESAIGFAEWIVDDDAKRKKGLEEARRNMEMVREDWRQASRRAAGRRHESGRAVAAQGDGALSALCEIGANLGVAPQVEVWGFSKTLSRLGESALVAIESGHPQACILADVYHLLQGRVRVRRA